MKTEVKDTVRTLRLIGDCVVYPLIEWEEYGIIYMMCIIQTGNESELFIITRLEHEIKIIPHKVACRGNESCIDYIERLLTVDIIDDLKKLLLTTDFNSVVYQAIPILDEIRENIQ